MYRSNVFLRTIQGVMIDVSKISDLMRSNNYSSWCIKELSGDRLHQHVVKGDSVESAVEAWEQAWPIYSQYGKVRVIATPDSAIGKGNKGIDWINQFTGGSNWRVTLNGNPMTSTGNNTMVPYEVLETRLGMQKLEFEMEKLREDKASNSLIPPQYQEMLAKVIVSMVTGTAPQAEGTLSGNVELNLEDTDEELNELEKAMSRLLKEVPEEKVIKLLNALADNPQHTDTLLALI